MTAPIEPISDEVLAELEKIASYREPSFINQKICNGTICSLIARLRAAEAYARRYCHLLEHCVDTHRGEQTPILVCSFGLPITGWREEVARRIDATMEPKP